MTCGGSRNEPRVVHSRHPGLPEAGHHLQGHHAAAARSGRAGRGRGAGWRTGRGRLQVDLVVAAEARGFILGAALARELGVGFVPARKPGKLPAETVSAEYILEYGVDALEMHADALAHGARVLLHDDLLATGGTARALAELIEGRGGVDRGLRLPGRAVVPGRAREALGLRRQGARGLRVRREQVFWGWGEPGAGPSLPEHADALLREELGIDGGVVARPVALEDVRLPDRRRSRTACASGSRRWPRCATTARRACCAAAASPTWICWRSAPATCSSAPDAVVAPGDAAQVAAVLRECAQAGVAVVPFGGGTSVVGGLGGRVAVRVARPRPARPRDLDRPVVADRRVRAGDPAARGRRGAALAGTGARPRAAELRVGDGRRLRGDPLRRADVDRPRADRRAGGGARVRDAVGLAGHAGRARERRRTGVARARARVRGDARA